MEIPSRYDRGSIPPVNLRDLRAFIAIAEEQSFSKAARRLFMSQPPLTRQIRAFEEEIGVTLFIRSKQGAQLTNEGRLLLDRARAIAEQTTEFLNTARGLQNREVGVVRIGIAWRLWEVVNRVRVQHAKRFPSVTIEGHDIFSSFQLDALNTNVIDVGFLRPPVDSAHLHAEVILQEQFVVLVSESSPLARRASLRVADLAAEPLLLYSRAASVGLHDRILSFYAAAGVKPTIVPASVGPARDAGLIPIASGKGIFISTANPLSGMHFGSGIVAVPLDEPDATVGVAVAWRKDERARHVLEFLQSIRDVFLPLYSLS